MRAMILLCALAACTADPHDEVDCGDWGRQFDDGATCDAACEDKNAAPLDGKTCTIDVLGVKAEVASHRFGDSRGICEISSTGAKWKECE